MPDFFVAKPPNAESAQDAQHPALAQIRALNSQQPQAPNPDHLRQLMYMLQAADALNTSDFLKSQPGSFETDPLLRGVAKPGNPLPMAAAFGLEDLIMNLLTRHSPKAQHNAELTQALLNAGGILKTNARAAKDTVKP